MRPYHLLVPHPPDFTLHGLHALLSGIKERGYNFRFFTENTIAAHGDCLLRHDIDLNLDMAVQVADLEQSLAIESTYFVLTTSEAYNTFSRSGRHSVSQILRCGHRLGLHFDPFVWLESTVSLEEAILREARAIEDAFSISVETFSFHRPGTLGNSGPPRVGGLVNAYAPAFTEDICYSSDSMGWWRYGSFVESAAFRDCRSVQLLLHPIWWTSAEVMHPGRRLDELVDESHKHFRASLIQTITPYAAYTGDSLGGPQWPPMEILRPSE